MSCIHPAVTSHVTPLLSIFKHIAVVDTYFFKPADLYPQNPPSKQLTLHLSSQPQTKSCHFPEVFLYCGKPQVMSPLPRPTQEAEIVCG